MKRRYKCIGDDKIKEWRQLHYEIFRSSSVHLTLTVVMKLAKIKCS